MTRVIIRKLEAKGAAPLGNLIKADALQAVVDADRVVVAAEAEARRACEAAAARGREAGAAEAREARTALLAQTADEVRGYLRGAEGSLAAIVVEAVRRVVGSFDDEELAGRVVGELLREAAGAGQVRLRVSPGDLHTVRARISAIKADLPEIESVEVDADSAVAAGGCRMETDLGFLATSLGERLEAVRAAVVDGTGA